VRAGVCAWDGRLTRPRRLHAFEFESATGQPMDIDTEILGITMVPAHPQKVRAIPRPAARLLKSEKFTTFPNTVQTR